MKAQRPHDSTERNNPLSARMCIRDRGRIPFEPMLRDFTVLQDENTAVSSVHIHRIELYTI